MIATTVDGVLLPKTVMKDPCCSLERRSIAASQIHRSVAGWGDMTYLNKINTHDDPITRQNFQSIREDGLIKICTEAL